MKEVLETYKPHILTRRRRLIEDCVRDLRLNNDHIHIIEQEMRKSVKVRLVLVLLLLVLLQVLLLLVLLLQV